MGSYYDDHYNKNLKKTQDEIKKQQAQNTATSNAYVADLNAIVDKNISNSVNKVQGEIDKLPTQYQSSFDANAIQQLINERQVAERMANMGMTNSGLNRTQQTAINIQRSNADAALRTQINSATNSLKQQIADLYASGESQKAENSAKARYDLEQKNQAVYENMMNNLYSSSSAYEKAMIEADAKAEEARIKAAQEKQKQYTKWALENGYGYDSKGNLIYTGLVKNNSGEYVDIEDKTSSLKTPTNEEYDEIFNMYVMEEGYKNPEKFIKSVLKKYPGYNTDAIIDYLESVQMSSDGGKNYGPWYTLGLGYGGIDENGSISFGNKNVTTMQDLYNRLKKAGYNSDVAEKMVINYQHYMGI
ncbi:MAG: hypothetical protein U0L88_00970 [Acutalibacteraceae bacterium]|nr:hypothetical protein [Acutalibacteraceae bacterium]